RRRHTRFSRDWSSDVCSSDLNAIYSRYLEELDPVEMERLRKLGVNRISDLLPILRSTPTPEESMAINRITSGAIIIAGAGMCNEIGRASRRERRQHLQDGASR